MKIYVFPPSGRVVGIVALKNYLALDCELTSIDLGRGDQRAPEYAALNPNHKMPTLEDEGVVLWESNAILFYMASKRPESGVWPSDLKGQADVLRPSGITPPSNPEHRCVYIGLNCRLFRII